MVRGQVVRQYAEQLETVAQLEAQREIANAVWFLASSLADYVTGQVLYVDGGFKME
jgi:enoyl-[acyl-carrier-protein] reductase (NADH)